MAVRTDSRFRFSGLVNVVGAGGVPIENARVGIPYPRPPVFDLIDRPNTFVYAVKESDTWASLAGRLLRGRSDLWWVIAEMTGVIDPWREFRPGRTAPNYNGAVIVPQFDSVAFDILTFPR